ncbi:MAG: GAF domain-containing protein [Chloroflexi bacterium]|nr:GAF domain-containing protein [Chloroflexota bacterium]
MIPPKSDEPGQGRGGAKRQTQTRRLKAAAELAALAAAAGKIADVYTHAAARAAALLGADGTSVRIQDETTGQLVLCASAGPLAPRAKRSIAPGEGLSGRAFAASKAAATHRLSPLAAEWPDLPADGPRAGMAVPLRVGTHVTGTLAAVGRRGVRFSTDDLAVLDLFGRVIGAALGRVTALTAAQRRAERLETLHEVALTLAQAHDPSAVLRLIVTRARALFEGESAAVRLWDRERRALVLAASDGGSVEPPLEALRPGEGAAGRAFATDRPLIVDDYAAWPGALPSSPSPGPRSVLAVPLRLRAQRLGVIVVTTSRLRAFHDEDAQLLALFAQQAAMAFTQARAVAEERAAAEYARRLAVLHALVAEVVQQTDEQQVLERAVQAASQLLNVEAARLWLLDPATDELVVRVAHGDERLPPVFRIPRTACVQMDEAMHTGAAVAVDDYPALSGAAPDLVAAGVTSSLASPLLAGGERLGALFVYALRRREWSAEDRHLLEILAHYAAEALVSARRLVAARLAAQLDAALRLAREAAHRVNNPLTIATGHVDLLLHVGTLGPRERAMAEKAMEGLVAAAEAVRDLQHIARGAEGQDVGQGKGPGSPQ